MTFKPTILNIGTGLFIIGCFLYTVFNYRQLSAEEGWGIVAMVGLLGIGVTLLITDFIIQRIFKNRTTINLIGTAIVIVVTLVLLLR